MTIPAMINSKWLATLADDELKLAEAELHSEFKEREEREQARSGGRYVLMQGPPDLVNAYLRWLTVNNASKRRGLNVNRRPLRPALES
jgi:hypothetical protein